MLDGLTLGVLGFLGFFQQGDGTDLAIASYASLQWQEAGLFEIRYQQDTNTQTIVDRYLAQLDSGGKDPALQGIWLESAWSTLGSHQGNQPLSAASLTKIATTLAALEQWPLTHRFTTRVYTTGTVANGLVQGDLVIEAGGDPLFVWEEAIALGNALNQAEIRQIEGDLIIVGDFMMNYVAEPATSGTVCASPLINAPGTTPSKPNINRCRRVRLVLRWRSPEKSLLAKPYPMVQPSSLAINP